MVLGSCRGQQACRMPTRCHIRRTRAAADGGRFQTWACVLKCCVCSAEGRTWLQAADAAVVSNLQQSRHYAWRRAAVCACFSGRGWPQEVLCAAMCAAAHTHSTATPTPAHTCMAGRVRQQWRRHAHRCVKEGKGATAGFFFIGLGVAANNQAHTKAPPDDHGSSTAAVACAGWLQRMMVLYGTSPPWQGVVNTHMLCSHAKVSLLILHNDHLRHLHNHHCIHDVT